MSTENDYEDPIDDITKWLVITGITAGGLLVAPFVLRQLAAIIRGVKEVVRAIND